MFVVIQIDRHWEFSGEHCDVVVCDDMDTARQKAQKIAAKYDVHCAEIMEVQDDGSCKYVTSVYGWENLKRYQNSD